MGQKVHPLGFRVTITENYRSSWFTKLNNYSHYLSQDYLIRQSILNYFTRLNRLENKKNLSDFFNLIDITISRQFDQVQICINVASIKSLLNSETIESIIDKLQSFIIYNLRKSFLKNSSNSRIPKILISVQESPKLESNAIFVAKCLVEDLENRVPFRKAIKNVVEIIQKRKSMLGVKIRISGRLNGIEMARSEWVREGRIPLQTLAADIEYCKDVAQTKYGILGIKVWVYKGEYKRSS